MKVIHVKGLVSVILLLTVLASCSKINNLVFRGMDNLPKGEFLASYDSPSTDYSVNIYLCGGGATVDFSIRGELVENNNGSKKNIYWSYHEQEADVEWLDEETVVINDRTLNVLKDVYDFRK